MQLRESDKYVHVHGGRGPHSRRSRQIDDVTAALSDVRDMLHGQSGWESEFTALVQQVVQQDAGWAWEGFWRMVHHNVKHPSCDVCLLKNLTTAPLAT